MKNYSPNILTALHNNPQKNNPMWNMTNKFIVFTKNIFGRKINNYNFSLIKIYYINFPFKIIEKYSWKLKNIIIIFLAF